ncbi:MAG: hypothetical protein JWO09_527 [Bacteroidetes bacterium]|nr:hypothetical protein [Bacteroidota bacterium]
MKKIIGLFIACCLFNIHFIQAQDSCMSALPFCTGTTYTYTMTPGTPAPSGPDYGCLGAQLSPYWFSVHVTTSGSIVITGAGTDPADDPIDIDYIYWGPFSSLSGVCYSQLDAAHILGCDYSTNNLININIPSAIAGSYYMVMVSDYSGMPATLSYEQTAGTGAASCVLPCTFSSITATPGACNPATNTYSVTGTMNFSNPPSTGTLTVFGSCGGSQTFSTPFSSPANYTLSGLGANGSSCFVTAIFSASSSCNANQVYTAPALCNPALAVPETASGIMELKVEPNPSDGRFRLSFSAPASNDVMISINDISGRCVYKETLTKYAGNYAKELDLTAFDKGMYFVRITTERGRFTQKIIYN